jgi:hypothetical protein
VNKRTAPRHLRSQHPKILDAVTAALKAAGKTLPQRNWAKMIVEAHVHAERSKLDQQLFESIDPRAVIGLTSLVGGRIVVAYDVGFSRGTIVKHSAEHSEIEVKWRTNWDGSVLPNEMLKTTSNATCGGVVEDARIEIDDDDEEDDGGLHDLATLDVAMADGGDLDGVDGSEMEELD